MKSCVWMTAMLALVSQLSTTNLLRNGDARQHADGWTPHGVATTEVIGGVPCFTVRAQGSFEQLVTLPDGSAGMYAAVLGRGYTERADGPSSITGLPYLYATVLTPNRRRFLAYWQGQKMLARPERVSEWVVMSGVFRVPEGAAYVSIQLRQAEQKGLPQDGSAARFADVRLHLFSTEEGARAFVEAYPPTP